MGVLSLQTFNINVDGQIVQNILLPTFLLSLPLLDMIRVVFSRLRDSKSPFYPDRKHLHHLLINLGLSPIKVVLSIFSFVIIQSILLIHFY